MVVRGRFPCLQFTNLEGSFGGVKGEMVVNFGGNKTGRQIEGRRKTAGPVTCPCPAYSV